MAKQSVVMSVVNKLQAITETSCLVNIMHEILVDYWNKKIACIAVCPTRRLEKHVGFDVALPGFDKVVALQFKAYKRHNYKALDYFAIYQNQHNTLIKYPPKCAFYIFPDYKTHSQMNQDRALELQGQRFKILNNTWFVEVHSIRLGTRMISRNDLINRTIPSIRWHRLSGMIKKCSAGFSIVRIKDHFILMDPEEKEVEVLGIPSGKFSLLYTRFVPTTPKRQQNKVVFA